MNDEPTPTDSSSSPGAGNVASGEPTPSGGYLSGYRSVGASATVWDLRQPTTAVELGARVDEFVDRDAVAYAAAGTVPDPLDFGGSFVYRFTATATDGVDVAWTTHLGVDGATVRHLFQFDPHGGPPPGW